MIRKSTRVFIWIYSSLAVFIIFLSLWREKRFDPIIFSFLILLAVLYGLGLFIGLVISILLRRPAHEKTFYFIGQCLSLALLLVILMESFFEDTLQPYADRNERMMSNTNLQTELAYDKMKSNFSSANDYLMHTYFSIGRDSIENFEVSKAWTVYFVYNLKKHPKTTYFSKFIVFKNQASIAEFQIQTKNSQEFKMLLQVNKDLNDLMNKYEPDREERNDSFKLK